MRGEDVKKFIAAIKDHSLHLEISLQIEDMKEKKGCLESLKDFLAGFFVADFFVVFKWVDRLVGFHGRIEKNFKEVDKFFDRVIWEHITKEEEEEEERSNNINSCEKEDDIVNILLWLHKVAILSGGFLSRIDQVKAILWNPRVMKKLQEKLKQATNGNTYSLIQECELEKLQYLK
ncbi:hypothetical protein IEQ34_009553 [Dendrobium chrysotoxum]|uniref:Uncharacterized protein n=1 Tax=Dendrobium chrysotoxum TaxID=161865 RepID=A0AAV7H364_DENCH|nr:hypothetical protein IEQ34_009553 [Dendrobium chrysotoxum]